MAIVFPNSRRPRGSAEPGADAASHQTSAGPASAHRVLGAHLREAAELSDAQIEEILLHQRSQGLRFGEAALQLRLVTHEQLLQALARQFEFPLVPASQSTLAPELVAAHDPFCAAAERFRNLRSQLLDHDAPTDGPRRALAVLSAQRGDGKSMMAANLAVSFSQLGLRTLLVDANLRQPRQHLLFGIERPVGLSGLLSGRPPSAFGKVEGFPSLSLLPAGGPPPNPLELIERPAFSLLLQDWLDRFDQVIVDTPAAEHGADAHVLALKCGAALVVARPGRTALPPLHRLVAGLRGGTTALRGVVFNEG